MNYENHNMEIILFDGSCVFANTNDGSDGPGESYFSIKPDLSDS